MKIDRELLEEYLIHYFSGEIDRLIYKYQRKVNEKLPDDIYCTLHTVRPSYVKVGYSGTYSDPTGNKAAKIVDIQIMRIRQYKYYLHLKEIVDKLLQTISDEDIVLIKSYINIEGHTLTETAKNSTRSYKKTRERAKKLIVLIEKELEAIHINPMKELKEGIPHGRTANKNL